MSFKFQLVADEDISLEHVPFVGLLSGCTEAKRRLDQLSFRCFSEEDAPRNRKRKRKRGKGEEGGCQLPRRKIQAESRALIYEGTQSIVSSPSSEPYLRYAIGVLDRKSSVVRVLPSDPRLFCLKQQLNPRLRGKGSVQQGQVNRRERRENLMESFGSRRSQLAMRGAERNRVVMENVAGKDALSTHLASSGSSSVSESVAETASRNARLNRLPYFNEFAEDAEDAYPWLEFSNIEERHELRASAERLRGEEEGTQGNTASNSLVAKLLKGAERLEETMQALYLGCLFYLLGSLSENDKLNSPSSSKKIKGKRKVKRPKGPIGELRGELAAACQVSPEFAQMVLERFCDRKDATNLSFSSTATVDRIMSHIIVLVLMLSGWKCRCDSLRTALSLTQKQLVPRLRDVGCKIMRGKTPIARLMTPLKKSFPKIARRRRK